MLWCVSTAYPDISEPDEPEDETYSDDEFNSMILPAGKELNDHAERPVVAGPEPSARRCAGKGDSKMEAAASPGAHPAA